MVVVRNKYVPTCMENPFLCEISSEKDTYLKCKQKRREGNAYNTSKHFM